MLTTISPTPVSRISIIPSLSMSLSGFLLNFSLHQLQQNSSFPSLTNLSFAHYCRADSVFSHLSSIHCTSNTPTNQFPLHQPRSSPFVSLAIINSHFLALDCTSLPPFPAIFLVLYFKHLPFHSLMHPLWLDQIPTPLPPIILKHQSSTASLCLCTLLPYLMLALYNI